MSESVSCPTTAEVAGLIHPGEYAEFAAGWRAGVARRNADPAPAEVIEDLALFLDSAAFVTRITAPE